jgi:hypothetical protein
VTRARCGEVLGELLAKAPVLQIVNP